MKITKELWNERAKNYKLDDFGSPVKYVQHIMMDICSKMVFAIKESDTPVIGLELSYEGQESFEKFILNDFCREFNLTPGMEIISSCRDCNKKKKSSNSFSDICNQNAILTSFRGEKECKISPSLLFGGDDILVVLKVSNYVSIAGIFYTSDSIETAKNMIFSIREKYSKLPKISGESKYTVNLVSMTMKGLVTTPLSVVIDDKINLEKQYNDDVPERKMESFLNNEDGGIAILHGIPGCGKTTYIKHLMMANPKLSFNVITQDLICTNLDEFRRFMISLGKNEILVLEDCEKLLLPRTNGSSMSPALSDLLNFADGILGDITKSKFILTFNTELSEIDQAILRKGRLKVKYEFLPLSGEKLKTLAKEVGFVPTEEELRTGLSLADIYNHDQTGYTQERAKIGFR